MNNNNINYSNDHNVGSLMEPLRIFDSSYATYSAHALPYSDYYTTGPPKIEAFDYNFWPTTTNTHNILVHSTIPIHDQTQTLPTTNGTIETLAPVLSVQSAPINTSTTISPTHHHHNLIHQHVCPPTPSSPQSCNEPSTWLDSGNYQQLHSHTNPSSYRCYPNNSCSFYPTNNFYDPSQSQWTSQGAIPIKFDPSYSPPPGYFESSSHLNHCEEQPLKDELSNSPRQSNWLQHDSSSTPLIPIPPKNPLNGKTRTRDKYRIVYTDQQRIELENEFILSKYISIPRKSALSLTLSLSERQIKIWFQNRRAKERKLSKKRQDTSSTRQLNNSNDVDSPSDGCVESPNYYQNYT